MIQSTQRCLRKTIGSAKFTYDELLTSVTKVEMILNSRPLSYISSDDIEEPLTSSLLLVECRVLHLPDTPTCDDIELEIECARDELTQRMKHLSKTLDDFWKRWKTEYLLELSESHRYYLALRGVLDAITIGDIVVVHKEDHLQGLWQLGKVERLIEGTDSCISVPF